MLESTPYSSNYCSYFPEGTYNLRTFFKLFPTLVFHSHFHSLLLCNHAAALHQTFVFFKKLKLINARKVLHTDNGESAAAALQITHSFSMKKILVILFSFKTGKILLEFSKKKCCCCCCWHEGFSKHGPTRHRWAWDAQTVRLSRWRLLSWWAVEHGDILEKKEVSFSFVSQTRSETLHIQYYKRNRQKKKLRSCDLQKVVSNSCHMKILSWNKTSADKYDCVNP